VPTFAENYVDVLMRSWKGELEFAQLIDCANQMESRQMGALAAVLYQTWLSRNTSPYSYAAYFNWGVTLSNLGDLEGALNAYRLALAQHPTFAQPYLNMGSAFERQNKVEEALNAWAWVPKTLRLTHRRTAAFWSWPTTTKDGCLRQTSVFRKR